MSNDERELIERHLLAHAAEYCPQCPDPPGIELVRLSRRAAARLYWYRIGNGAVSRVVIAKVPGCRPMPNGNHAGGRPRLMTPHSPDRLYALEHRALQLLERRFAGGADPRFGAVSIMGRLDEARAYIMGVATGSPLSQSLIQLSRLRREPAPTLRHAVQNAGAWLRAYHELKHDGTRTRQAHRSEFTDLVERYCDHLGGTLSRGPWFDRLARLMTGTATQVLPVELPLGLAHGDFAMRNVLVDAGCRVVVIDTNASWMAPVYEDLAKFALAMRVSRAQVYSHGLAFSEERLRIAHRWLLSGYFRDEPVPEEQIALYQLLLLLDKWSFELALPAGRFHGMAAARRRRLNSWYTKQVESSARLFT